MASDPARLLRQGARALARPWPLLLTGLGVVVLGVALRETPATPVRVLCLVSGLVMAGLAVTRRLQTASQDLDERVTSAGLVAMAAFTALIACLGTEPNKEADRIPHDPAALSLLSPEEIVRRSGEDWDSIRILLGVLVGVGLFGSVLVLLPQTPRRIVASLLVLFHFGGITTAVTAIAPRDQPAPWVSQQLWVRVYRPYLTFMYLTNAYHFYSPDPGPPSLLWFRVQYEDKTYRWVKLPVRKESPIALHYQRGLALAEYTNNPMPRLPLSEWEKAEWERHGQPYNHDTWEILITRRQQAEFNLNPLLSMPADVLPNLQYSEPQDYVKEIVKSYARHIASSTPNPDAPDMPVENVRVYRVRHDVITPAQLALGIDPLDPFFYKPVYLGKFDRDGKLLDPTDPLLYWYVPMAHVPPNYGKDRIPLLSTRPKQRGDKLLDGVAIHAGDTKELKDE